MNTFGISEKGLYRTENQDSFEVCAVGENTLAVVCDGMGGAAAGLQAGKMAVEHFASYGRMALTAPGSLSVEELLRQAVDFANREVYRFSCASEEYTGMGTTLVAGYFTADLAVLVNLGDSRAYRVAKDGILQITKDHSLVQEMVDRGELTPAQAKKHPRRNIITRALGSESVVSADVFEMPVRKEDIFLLCTDGLVKALEEPEIHRLILAADTTEEAGRSLMNAALDNDARDNITAVIVGFSGNGGTRNGQ